MPCDEGAAAERGDALSATKLKANWVVSDRMSPWKRMSRETVFITTLNQQKTFIEQSHHQRHESKAMNLKWKQINLFTHPLKVDTRHARLVNQNSTTVVLVLFIRTSCDWNLVKPTTQSDRLIMCACSWQTPGCTINVVAVRKRAKVEFSNVDSLHKHEVLKVIKAHRTD